MDAEPCGQPVGNLVPDVVGRIGYLALETVDGGGGAATSPSQKTVDAIADSVAGGRRLVCVAVQVDQILSKGRSVKLDTVRIRQRLHGILGVCDGPYRDEIVFFHKARPRAGQQCQ